MTVEQDIFVGGHVAKSALRELAATPDRFDDDTVEEIWQHLDQCEACIGAYEALCNNGSPRRRQSDDTPEMEGLITGQVFHTHEVVQPLEMESAVEAGERLKRARDGGGDPSQLGERRPHIAISAINERDVAARSAPPATPDGAVGSPQRNQPHRSDRPSTARQPAARQPAARQPAARPQPGSKPPPPNPSTRPVAPPVARRVTVDPEPLEQLLRDGVAFVLRPRNALVLGGAALLVAVVILAVMTLSGRDGGRLNAGWEPLEVLQTRTPLQEAITRKMWRGRIPAASGTDVTLDFRGVDKLVIAVDLDFIRAKTAPHELIVRNPEGVNVFQEPIPQVYLDDGRLFLRLLPEQFEVGPTYRLELITRRADESTYIVAESVFDIVK